MSHDPLTSTDSYTALPDLVPAASPREDLAARGLVRTVAGAIITSSVLVFMLDYAEEVLVPLTLALFINLVLGPGVRQLRRRFRIPRPLGAFIVLGSITGAVFTVAVMSATAVQRWATTVPATLVKLRTAIAEGETLGKLLSAAREADATVTSIGDSVAIPVAVAREGVPTWLVQGSGTVVEFVFVWVLAYLMLSAGDRFRRRTRPMFEGSPLRKRVLAAIQDIETSVSTYVVTVSVINLGLGLAVALAMWIVGLPDPLLWGIAAGLLNFVPYIGPICTAALIGIAGFTTFGTLSGALLAVGVYLAVNSIEAFVVTPIVLGHRLQLSPVATLVAVLFWTWLWGFGGALVAIPSLVVVYCVCAQISPLRPVAMIISQ